MTAIDGYREGTTLRSVQYAKWLFLYLCAALAVLPWLVPYFATNDGPAHISIIAALNKIGKAGFDTTSQFYEAQVGIFPNRLAYVLLDALDFVTNWRIAEKIIQSTVMAGLPLAGYYAVSFDKPKAWLALAFIPIALNQTLVWGLYNFGLSIILSLLLIGILLRIPKHPAALIWPAIAVTLILTYFAHGIGFIMSVGVLGIFCLYEWIKGGFLRALFFAGAAIPSMIIFLIYMAQNGGGEIAYGLPLTARLSMMASINIILQQFRWDQAAVFTLTVTLAAALVMAVRARLAMNGLQIGDALLVLVVACVVISLIIPDVAGGGWTHFARSLVFLYLAIVLWLSSVKFTARFQAGFAITTAVVGQVLWGSLAYTQAKLSDDIVEFLSASDHIADHSTILPIIDNMRGVGDDGKPIVARFDPFFQLASPAYARRGV